MNFTGLLYFNKFVNGSCNKFVRGETLHYIINEIRLTYNAHKTSTLIALKWTEYNTLCPEVEWFYAHGKSDKFLGEIFSYILITMLQILIVLLFFNFIFLESRFVRIL